MPTTKHGKICYIFMPSKDPQQSADFYRTVFGWNIRANDEGSISFDDSVAEVSGTFTTDRPPAEAGSLEIHIMVDDLQSTIAAIRAAGGSVDPSSVHTDNERWAPFLDPSGNRLAIYQHAGR